MNKTEIRQKMAELDARMSRLLTGQAIGTIYWEYETLDNEYEKLLKELREIDDE